MSRTLTLQEASDAVSGLGWRYVLGTLRASVPVRTLTQAAQLAGTAIAAASDADQHLHIDLRPDRLVLTLQSLDLAKVTVRDVELASLITTALREAGSQPEPGAQRSVQAMEIAIDAMDIAAIRPFWKAVLGYGDEPGSDGLIDPAGQGPAVWFQQMSEPRTERNRIHFDVSVPHDEAPRRLAAALAAGGRLLSDAEAPAFWVLADSEGNEACVTTWQGRD